MQVAFWLNGKRRTAEVEPDQPARCYLGDDAARQASCADGSCMQCAVLLGGRVVPTCTLPAYRLDEADVVDAAGLQGDELHHDIMRAFDKIGISRCKEALPSLLFLAYQLLTDNPLPGEDELREYSRHITTRCVSRDEFERAVRLAGRVHKRKRHDDAR